MSCKVNARTLIIAVVAIGTVISSHTLGDISSTKVPTTAVTTLKIIASGMLNTIELPGK